MGCRVGCSLGRRRACFMLRYWIILCKHLSRKLVRSNLHCVSVDDTKDGVQERNWGILLQGRMSGAGEVGTYPGGLIDFVSTVILLLH